MGSNGGKKEGGEKRELGHMQFMTIQTLILQLQILSFKILETQVPQLCHISLADEFSYGASFAYFLLHSQTHSESSLDL